VARANSLPAPRALPRRALIVTARDLLSLISTFAQWWNGVRAAGNASYGARSAVMSKWARKYSRSALSKTTTASRSSCSISVSRASSSTAITGSMRLIGGLSKVTRHSDGVDLSRLKRVYAMRAVPFEGELLMLFSFVRPRSFPGRSAFGLAPRLIHATRLPYVCVFEHHEHDACRQAAAGSR